MLKTLKHGIVKHDFGYPDHLIKKQVEKTLRLTPGWNLKKTNVETLFEKWLTIRWKDYHKIAIRWKMMGYIYIYIYIYKYIYIYNDRRLMADRNENSADVSKTRD